MKTTNRKWPEKGFTAIAFVFLFTLSACPNKDNDEPAKNNTSQNKYDICVLFQELWNGTRLTEYNYNNEGQLLRSEMVMNDSSKKKLEEISYKYDVEMNLNGNKIPSEIITTRNGVPVSRLSIVLTGKSENGLDLTATLYLEKDAPDPSKRFNLQTDSDDLIKRIDAAFGFSPTEFKTYAEISYEWSDLDLIGVTKLWDKNGDGSFEIKHEITSIEHDDKLNPYLSVFNWMTQPDNINSITHLTNNNITSYDYLVDGQKTSTLTFEHDFATDDALWAKQVNLLVNDQLISKTDLTYKCK